MLNFIYTEAKTREDIDAIADLTWVSHSNPYRPFASITLAVFGPTKADREAGIQNSKERLWELHFTNPASHWMMAHEEETGKLVGASQWLVNEKTPFPNGPPKIIASWWPEDSVGRDFCSEMLNQAYMPRGAWMRRPCIVLNLISTHPDYRRLGIGAAMMRFVEEKSKELHLECWTEASEPARFLFEKFGYKVLIKYSLDPQKAVMSDEWRRLAHEHMPHEIYAMWKPEGGVFTETTVMPWDRGHSNTLQVNDPSIRAGEKRNQADSETPTTKKNTFDNIAVGLERLRERAVQQTDSETPTGKKNIDKDIALVLEKFEKFLARALQQTDSETPTRKKNTHDDVALGLEKLLERALQKTDSETPTGKKISWDDFALRLEKSLERALQKTDSETLTRKKNTDEDNALGLDKLLERVVQKMPDSETPIVSWLAELIERSVQENGDYMDELRKIGAFTETQMVEIDARIVAAVNDQIEIMEIEDTKIEEDEEVKIEED